MAKGTFPSTPDTVCTVEDYGSGYQETMAISQQAEQEKAARIRTYQEKHQRDLTGYLKELANGNHD